MIKNIKSVLKLALAVGLSFALYGCATLSYVGDDFDSQNILTVKTQEEFVFNTYKKTVDNAGVKIGITRTAVPEILALYVQIENFSYETPYLFKVEDLKLFDSQRQIPFVPTTNYLSVWQNQEAASMSSVGSLGTAISTMTGLNNYNDYNQSIAQKNAQETSDSAYKKMQELQSGISKHSVRVSSTISPRKSQYFYFFFEDPDDYPVKVIYKDLNYQFKL